MKRIFDKRFGIASLVIVGIVSISIGIILNTISGVTPSTEAEVFWQEGNGASPVSFTGPNFVQLSKKLNPAVVNISTTQVIKGSKHHNIPPQFKGPFEDFFGDDFFDKFFGDLPQKEYKSQSLGSGFIINKNGYVMTNNHVVEHADEVLVILSSGDKYTAKIIGKDSRTDIALLKIEPKEDLPVVALGDSDKVAVGQWVLAIGNPFGLGHTVTAGIVSAKGRVIGAGPYDDFIQTDASINPGNSGGPLFNIAGEVIGINTAIISGGQGIGFAIPINMAKNIVSQLKKSGKVVRGWLGVSIQEVTPELAKSFGLKKIKGALVSSVNEGDPAEKAGVKAGDIIVEFDGKEIATYHDLPRIVANTPPDKKVKLKVIRNGKEVVLNVKLGELKEEKLAKKDAHEESGKLGLTVKEITPDIAGRFGIEDSSGVIIVSVKAGSPADNAGLRRGDVIKEINHNEVTDLKDYLKALDNLKKSDVVLFRILRGRGSLYIAVKTE